MDSMLDIGAARVFYDGLATDPMLDHPEGLAVHRDGSVWCGGERGQVYRIEPDGYSMKQVASSSGFSQGMAFDGEDNLFVCDTRLGKVMRLDAKSGAYESFAEGAAGLGISICNDLAFGPDGSLYVSDSHAFKEPGPGIFRFAPDGTGELWYDEPADFT
ncbi:MAG: SMP-30/gluconolactonase/LRE family protein, partial [Rubrobacter sp.]